MENEIVLKIDDDRVPVSQDLVQELLIIAHKHSNGPLKDVCSRHLSKIVSHKNAIELLLMGLDFDCHDLKDSACHFIAMNYKKMKNSGSFAKLLEQNHEALLAILDASCSVIEKTKKVTGYINQFRFKLPGLEVLESETIYVKNLPWLIQVERSFIKSETYLGVFLMTQSTEKSYSYKVNFRLKLISHTDESLNFETEDTLGEFNDRCDAWGFPDLIVWPELVSKDKGYVKNGAILIELIITFVE